MENFALVKQVNQHYRFPQRDGSDLSDKKIRSQLVTFRGEAWRLALSAGDMYALLTVTCDHKDPMGLWQRTAVFLKCTKNCSAHFLTKSQVKKAV